VVNLPDFTLRVMHNGGQVWTTRDRQAQHGDPAAERGDEIPHGQSDLTVPQSIVRNEYLPALA
jgi:hypothetical protein